MRLNQYVLLSMFLLATNVFAASAHESLIRSIKDGHAILQLGYYRGTQGERQHINIQDLIGDTFTVTQHHDNNALIGLGYFLDGNTLDRFKMSYGINGFYLGQTTVTGNVIQEDLFTNLSYHYNLTNMPIYLVARSIVDVHSPTFAVVLDAGIGPNFMKAYQFREQSLDGITIQDDPFTSNTTTTVSGTLGISIRMKQLFVSMPLECGYRFFYLGQGHFNTNNNQIINKLKTGQTYANAVTCAVSL